MSCFWYSSAVYFFYNNTYQNVISSYLLRSVKIHQGLLHKYWQIVIHRVFMCHIPVLHMHGRHAALVSINYNCTSEDACMMPMHDLWPLSLPRPHAECETCLARWQNCTHARSKHKHLCLLNFYRFGFGMYGMTWERHFIVLMDILL